MEGLRRDFQGLHFDTRSIIETTFSSWLSRRNAQTQTRKCAHTRPFTHANTNAQQITHKKQLPMPWRDFPYGSHIFTIKCWNGPANTLTCSQTD